MKIGDEETTVVHEFVASYVTGFPDDEFYVSVIVSPNDSPSFPMAQFAVVRPRSRSLPKFVFSPSYSLTHMRHEEVVDAAMTAYKRYGREWEQERSRCPHSPNGRHEIRQEHLDELDEDGDVTCKHCDVGGWATDSGNIEWAD